MNAKWSWAVGLVVAACGLLAPAALGGGDAARVADTAAPGVGVVETQASARAAKAARRAKKRAYRGTFPAHNGAKVKLTTRFRRGKPRSISRIDYRRLPAICEESGGPQPVGWAFTFGRGTLNVKPNRRFGVSGTDPNDGSTVTLKGRFSRNFKKVTGRFKTNTLFPEVPDADPPLPEEFCQTVFAKFKARR